MGGGGLPKVDKKKLLILLKLFLPYWIRALGCGGGEPLSPFFLDEMPFFKASLP